MAYARENDNGFELWRRLNIDHEGGAAVTRMVGRRDVIRFPACNNVADLNARMDKWFEECHENGTDVPEDVVYEMFLDILPDEICKEIRKDRHITTWQHAHEYVLSEMGRLNNERLAAVHAARRKHPRQQEPPREQLYPCCNR